MCDLTDDSIDHNKNRLDAISMVMREKGKDTSGNRGLPRQFQKLILPYLQEVTFKADTVKLPDFEASGIEITCKFNNPNSQEKETVKVKTKIPLMVKFRQFMFKQFFSSIFQMFIMSYFRFLP
jgi:hypothetical protein